jgi:hypothetical protein
MGSIKRDVLSDGATNQSRREALKRFGRYAAFAPAAMVLLESRASHAGKGKSRGRQIWAKARRKGGGDY